MPLLHLSPRARAARVRSTLLAIRLRYLTSKSERPVLTEDENVDPCPSIEVGSPIRKRQRLLPHADISNLDLSAPPSPSPSESLKHARTESPLVTTISSRCASPCNPKPITLQVPQSRNRQRSNASASFFEPNGASAELITRPDSPLMCPETSEMYEGLPAIAWEMENRDESYYGYGILSFGEYLFRHTPSLLSLNGLFFLV